MTSARMRKVEERLKMTTETITMLSQLQKRYSWRELGKLIGLSHVYLYKISRLQHLISKETYYKIKRFYQRKKGGFLCR